MEFFSTASILILILLLTVVEQVQGFGINLPKWLVEIMINTERAYVPILETVLLYNNFVPLYLLCFVQSQFFYKGLDRVQVR